MQENSNFFEDDKIEIKCDGAKDLKLCSPIIAVLTPPAKAFSGQGKLTQTLLS